MEKIFETVIEEVEKFNDSIREDLSRKGIDTTFTASNSLQVVVSTKSVSSIGIDYLQYLNRGRPPGKFPPMNVIERWVDIKQLKIDPFVVARSIAERGSRIYRNRELGLKLEDKVQVLQDNLNKKLPKFINQEITIQLNKIFI